MALSDLVSLLQGCNGEVLARVAIDMPSQGPGDPGHLRMLDIDVVGFGNAEGDQPPVELRTEPWNGLVMVIRQKGLRPGEDLGDRSYGVEPGQFTLTREPGGEKPNGERTGA